MFRISGSKREGFFLALLFAYCIFLVGSNRVFVSPIDGFIRASMARNIVEIGSLFPPVFPDEPMVDHPPLYIWSIAASFKIFGVNDFAAVFPGRLFGFFCVLATFWLALLLGFNREVALLGALVLAATRDFVLISVQGGIEPLLTLTALLAFCFALLSGPHFFLYGLASGLMVVLTAFSKGPPALWPALFIPLLIIIRNKNKAALLLGYSLGLVIFSFIWALWIKLSGLGWYWDWYWKEQVLGSAVEGRGNLQGFDPLYFIKILITRYWPWLPVLLLAIYSLLKKNIKKMELGSELVLLIFSLGFFGGFSIVSWKFWYYIAPCFPGFAILNATVIDQWLSKKSYYQKGMYGLAIICLFWILIANIFPISLSSRRPQEAHDFKDILLKSDVSGPVWFVEHSGDHNMLKTAGYWYFHRKVINVNNEKTRNEFLAALKKSVWILTEKKSIENCKKTWCQNILAQWESGETLLVLVKNN